MIRHRRGRMHVRMLTCMIMRMVMGVIKCKGDTQSVMTIKIKSNGNIEVKLDVVL